MYGPSLTMTYAQCPMKYYFRSRELVPKHVNYTTVAAITGRAFAKGLEAFFKGYSLQDCVNVAQEEARLSLEVYDDNDATYDDKGRNNADLIMVRLDKALTKFMVRHPFREPEWRLETAQTEVLFGNGTTGRPDLIIGTNVGWCLLDFKTKIRRPDPYKIREFLAEYEHSWQLYHYVTLARQYGFNVQQYAVCLVTFEPYEIHTAKWVVDEAYYQKVRDTAAYWWALMAWSENRGEFAMAPAHTDRYGLCEYAELCLYPDRDTQEIKDSLYMRFPKESFVTVPER